MKLIDADKLREHWLTNGENEYIYDTNAFLDSIDEQPTVDAVEVVHGYWKQTGEHFLPYQCSACESKEEGRTNYCPNCGAKMDGGQE